MTPHPPRKLGTFPSGEGSHKSDGRNFKNLCTNFADSLFAYSSHKTVTKLNLARLSARWHLIRLASSAPSPRGKALAKAVDEISRTCVRISPILCSLAHRVRQAQSQTSPGSSPGGTSSISLLLPPFPREKTPESAIWATQKKSPPHWCPVKRGWIKSNVNFRVCV